MEIDSSAASHTRCFRLRCGERKDVSAFPCFEILKGTQNSISVASEENTVITSGDMEKDCVKNYD